MYKDPMDTTKLYTCVVHYYFSIINPIDIPFINSKKHDPCEV